MNYWENIDHIKQKECIQEFLNERKTLNKRIAIA